MWVGVLDEFALSGQRMHKVNLFFKNFLFSSFSAINFYDDFEYFSTAFGIFFIKHKIPNKIRKLLSRGGGVYNSLGLPWKFKNRPEKRRLL